jgi:dihydrofolate reductase
MGTVISGMSVSLDGFVAGPEDDLSRLHRWVFDPTDGDKDVAVMGGADLSQQCLNAGLLDELQLQLVPVPLGEGIRWFDNLDKGIEWGKTALVEIPDATFLTHRVLK